MIVPLNHLSHESDYQMTVLCSILMVHRNIQRCLTEHIFDLWIDNALTNSFEQALRELFLRLTCNWKVLHIEQQAHAIQVTCSGGHKEGSLSCLCDCISVHNECTWVLKVQIDQNVDLERWARLARLACMVEGRKTQLVWFVKDFNFVKPAQLWVISDESADLCKNFKWCRFCCPVQQRLLAYFINPFKDQNQVLLKNLTYSEHNLIRLGLLAVSRSVNQLDQISERWLV